MCPFSGMLMVGANAGIVGMTKEHLGLALALSVPVFVVVTKIDMCPPNVLQVYTPTLIKNKFDETRFQLLWYNLIEYYVNDMESNKHVTIHNYRKP